MFLGQPKTNNAEINEASSLPSSPTKSIDLTGAKIGESRSGEVSIVRSAPSIILPYQKEDYMSHIALDIGGSLIKLVYFSKDTSRSSSDGHECRRGRIGSTLDRISGFGGKLHFVKFETKKLHEAVRFIRDKKLLERCDSNGSTERVRILATGGGAFKYADTFLQELDVVLEKEDEIECLVSGCNFFQTAISDECFTFHNGEASYQKVLPSETLYPYLLVNIGSGVSIIKVDDKSTYTRVSGSSLGGGTFWGLCKLLTGVKGFDELLELSVKGNSSNVDMLVGDIYGGRDYPQIGLSAETTASSFGKIISQDWKLEDYNSADIALAVCKMVSYNIGQLAYMNAVRYNLKRVLFGGFFIRGHAYTMETLSYAIRFWSRGEMAALFMRHEGFLCAMGAFLKVHPLEEKPRKPKTLRSISLRQNFKEVYTMGAPFCGSVKGEAIKDISEKVSWVEKFVEVGTAAAVAANQSKSAAPSTVSITSNTEISDLMPSSPSAIKPLDLHVGVLHFHPSLRMFPLLVNPEEYEPNTLDINNSKSERLYWLQILIGQINTVAQKASSSDVDCETVQRRAEAFARSFRAHLEKIKTEPAAYGVTGLQELLEMRELCLREFGFMDVYKSDKLKENEIALQVFPDLLQELDDMKPSDRLLALIQGVLAANIFDWGAQECVEKYQEGLILSIYKEARDRLSQRPWRVDDFDKFAQILNSKEVPPYRRVLIFADNAGADIVLGLLPLAREFLRFGCEVILAANSLPAINDITAEELMDVMELVCGHCEIISKAWRSGSAARASNKGKLPPVGDYSSLSSSSSNESLQTTPSQLELGIHESSEGSSARLYVVDSGQVSPCLDLRCVSADIARSVSPQDLVIIEGMGRAVHTNLYTKLKCDCLKLAMIKNKHLASSLFGGDLFDCICMYDEGTNS
eukprot:g3560.t1